jgi:hypothetical protein
MPEFNFLDQFDAAIEATAKTAKTAKTVDVSDIYTEIFKDDKSIKIMLACGLSWSEFKIEKRTPEKKSSETFKMMQPVYKSQDIYDRNRVKSYFVFRCSVAGLAAQNKGKISTVDVACLYIGLCRQYKIATSLRALIVKIANDLNIEAESKADVVTLKVSGDGFAHYIKHANIVLQSVKDAANSGDL